MRTYDEARDEARALVLHLHGVGNPDDKRVCILAGCDCAEQGARTPYHVHAFSGDRLMEWVQRHTYEQVLYYEAP